jgi:phosphoglycerate dehydrogenase-like enzyme
MLAFVRKLHLARDAQRERRCATADLERPAADRPARRNKLGLVGFGAIGQALARRALRSGSRSSRCGVIRRVIEAGGGAVGIERCPSCSSGPDWIVRLTGETRG